MVKILLGSDKNDYFKLFDDSRGVFVEVEGKQVEYLTKSCDWFVMWFRNILKKFNIILGQKELLRIS